jgi:hypothetical protein
MSTYTHIFILGAIVGYVIVGMCATLITLNLPGSKGSMCNYSYSRDTNSCIVTCSDSTHTYKLNITCGVTYCLYNNKIERCPDTRYLIGIFGGLLFSILNLGIAMVVNYKHKL